MAAPTTGFKTIVRTTAATAYDTKAERLAAWAGLSTIDTGANPLDFSTVDISGGAANSLVFYLAWKVTANGGNTLVDNFRIWDETGSPDGWGFTQAATKLYMASLKFEAAGTYGTAYVINAVTSTYNDGTYGFGGSIPGVNGIARAGAPSQNAYSGVGGTNIDITTIGTTDDWVGVALYLAVGAGEVTGTYKGSATSTPPATVGKEFAGSFQYDYS